MDLHLLAARRFKVGTCFLRSPQKWVNGELDKSGHFMPQEGVNPGPDPALKS